VVFSVQFSPESTARHHRTTEHDAVTQRPSLCYGHQQARNALEAT
jgi:hypothetical protein